MVAPKSESHIEILILTVVPGGHRWVMLMAIQFNFNISSVGHIYLIAGQSATAMALAHTIKEDSAFRHLPTYLLAKELAKQLVEQGFISASEVDWSFEPKKVFQVGFTKDEFTELFGSSPNESIAAFDLTTNPLPG